MPALVIGANLPDVDAPCSIHGIESLAMRRGLSHGPIALIVLPLVLAGLLIAWDRWQARRGKRPPDRLPIHTGWLLALAYLGCLSHPLFDWMNSYGVRLLEPFSHRWFYGDALFIIDPWMMAALGLGIWLSRRRERAGRDHWTRPARLAIRGVLAFVALNLGISQFAYNTAEFSYEDELGDRPEMIVSNAQPGAFWRRDVLWRGGGNYGVMPVSLFDVRNFLGHSEGRIRAAGPVGMADPRIAERTRTSPDARAFLFWSRMPVAEMKGDTITLRDQRFMQSRRCRLN